MKTSLCSSFSGIRIPRFFCAFGAPIAILLLLGMSARALANNQVLNPNFDSTLMLTNWNLFASAAPDPVGQGTALWDATHDAGSVATSGSASVTLGTTPAAANAAFGISQCINFGGTQSVSQVNYGTNFQVPASTTADGGVNVSIEMRLFTDSACTNFISGAGGSQGQTIVNGFTTGNTWYSAGDPNFLPPTIPQSAGSAEIRAYARRTNGNGNSYGVYFDNIFLSLNGTTPIVLQHFDVE